MMKKTERGKPVSAASACSSVILGDCQNGAAFVDYLGSVGFFISDLLLPIRVSE